MGGNFQHFEIWKVILGFNLETKKRDFYSLGAIILEFKIFRKTT